MLTQQQVDAYERDGYLSGIRVTDEDNAGRYRQLFDELEAQEGYEKCQIGLIDQHFAVLKP